MRYIVFLLGVNVGKRQVKMERLRNMLEDMGYRNVTTILASGNVLLDTDEKDPTVLKNALEKRLVDEFGFEIKVIVRSFEALQKLLAQNPFAGIPVTENTRLYVTFLTDKPTITLNIPYQTPDKDYRILLVSDTEACSVLTLSENKGTVDAMAILGKEFGKNITTRNWNTLEKIVAS